MRIVQERIDRENYLELCISKKELELIGDYLIISKTAYIQGEETNVGIKLGLDGEDDEHCEGI